MMVVIMVTESTESLRIVTSKFGLEEKTSEEIFLYVT